MATGVEYIYENRKYAAKATKEVILSAGAINSPQLLMLSGIGPRKQLDEFTIPTLVDNLAVGSNLHDHMMSFLTYKTNASDIIDDFAWKTWPGYLIGLAKYFLLGKGMILGRMYIKKHVR